MSRRDDVFISEVDDGIYDALNKGILRASGDIIGILHSDDLFFDDYVLGRVADILLILMPRLFSVTRFFSRRNNKMVRHYRS